MRSSHPANQVRQEAWCYNNMGETGGKRPGERSVHPERGARSECDIRPTKPTTAEQAPPCVTRRRLARRQKRGRKRKRTGLIS